MFTALLEELFEPTTQEEQYTRRGGVKQSDGTWDFDGVKFDPTSQQDHPYPILSLTDGFNSNRPVAVKEIEKLSNRAYAMRRLAREMEEVGVKWVGFYRLVSVLPVTTWHNSKGVGTGQQMVGMYDDKMIVIVETKLFQSGSGQGYHILFTDKNKSKEEMGRDSRAFKSRGYTMNYLDSNIYRYERSQGKTMQHVAERIKQRELKEDLFKPNAPEEVWDRVIDPKYVIERSDGKFDYGESLDVCEMKLESLTQLPKQFVKVMGSFFCDGNYLKDLKGAPRHIHGSFLANECDLTTLEGGPDFVGRNFGVSKNKLKNLHGAPRWVGGNCLVDMNELESLQGAPRHVGEDFNCVGNHLESLDGISHAIGGNVHVSYNAANWKVLLASVDIGKIRGHVTESKDFYGRLGKCYELSGRYVNQHDDGSVLVHGKITNRMGDGRTIHHAWVVKDDQVFDPVIDQWYDEELHQALFGSEEIERFDHEDVLVNILKYRHWGPWDGSEPPNSMFNVEDDDDE